VDQTSLDLREEVMRGRKVDRRVGSELPVVIAHNYLAQSPPAKCLKERMHLGEADNHQAEEGTLLRSRLHPAAKNRSSVALLQGFLNSLRRHLLNQSMKIIRLFLDLNLLTTLKGILP
jgi:hypothetical protein